MKPTSLPGNAREDRFPRRFESGVIVADNMFESMESALLEFLKKLAPVNFGFAQGDTDA